MPANQPITLIVQPWLPDTPDFSPQGCTSVLNVIPETSDAYTGFPSLSSAGITALAKRVQGVFAGTDSAGAVNIFAGTNSDLYRLQSGATSFSNVSKSAAAYSVAADEFWRFTLVNARVVACNFADPIQSFLLGTDTLFSNLSANAPKARYCAGVKNFLMVANTTDSVSGAAPWRTWWSAIGDPTSWPTPGSSSAQANQSDYNDLVGDFGSIQGIVGNLGTSDAALFFEHAVWRVVYTGPPDVFDFFPAEGVRGTPAPASITQLGSFAYYLGEDGFYSFDGTNSIGIGAGKVDKYFFSDLDFANVHRVVGAVDPVNRLVLWAYPGSGNAQGNPNHILCFHWPSGKWSIADVQTEYIFRALAFGYSLEGLDATGFNLDTLPYSLDSRIWAGGQLLLGGFDTSHRLGYFNGSNLAPQVDTNEIQPFPGQRTFLRNTRPLIDAPAGPTPTIAIGTRENLEAANAFNVGTAMNSLGWCPQRASGRYMRARITLPAASVFEHIQGVELDVDPAGVR